MIRRNSCRSRSTGFQPVCLPASHRARGCPCPSPDARYAHAIFAPSPPSRRRLRLTVAGHSPGSLHAGLRSLDAALAFAIVAALGQQRRLPGTGSPSLPTVAQVFNLCAFPLRIAPLAAPRSTGCQPVCLSYAQGFNLCASRLRVAVGVVQWAVEVVRRHPVAVGAEQPGSRTPSSASMRLAPARGPRVAPRTTLATRRSSAACDHDPRIGGMVVAAAPV